MKNIDNLETSNGFCKDRKKIMKKKDGFFKKLLSAAVAIGVFASFLANDTAAQEAGGPGDPRSHQFLNSEDPANTEDEGYRWRDSFNFTIKETPIVKWKFDDGSGSDLRDLTGANGIHEELSRIINNVSGVSGHKAAAAITIVVRNSAGTFDAYSQVVCERVLNSTTLQPEDQKTAPAISIPATVKGGVPNDSDCKEIITPKQDKDSQPYKAYKGYSMYYTSKMCHPGKSVSDHVCDLANGKNGVNIGINVNIPEFAKGKTGSGYSCCEGQIVARLFDNPSAELAPLFPIVIGNLLKQAGVNAKNIVLVVLHIHSHYDPCAKCAKVLAALSRLMNTGVDASGTPHALPQVHTELANNLLAGNARFLIEVSSNGTYTIDGNCSRAEASGLDGRMNTPLNITLGAPIAVGLVGRTPIPTIGGDVNTTATALNSLAIPNGMVPGAPGAPAADNFIFPNTFPPYVVFGRVDSDTQRDIHRVTSVTAAPHPATACPAAGQKPPVQ